MPRRHSALQMPFASAGVEVWFDQSELRGGDAWDQKIRLQIRECALFMPIVSENTQARPEGYFRLEWKLAVDRSHLMADDQPFLLPVIVDELSESSARVPDRFRERQWLRLAAGETPAALVDRVRESLLGDLPHSPPQSPGAAFPVETLTSTAPKSATVSTPAASKRWVVGATAAGILMVVGSAIFWILHRGSSGAPELQAVSNPLSLAILPLRNATGDPKLEYIADGLTASLSSTITNNLAINEDAFVTPPSVAAAYSDKGDPVKWLAKDFGVHFVLQGNVQRAASKIRVSADLVDTVKGTTVGSESYDGDQSNLFALQDKVKKNEAFENDMYIAAARDIQGKSGKQSATDYYVRGIALEFAKSVGRDEASGASIVSANARSRAP
jgi:TolB-like protein